MFAKKQDSRSCRLTVAGAIAVLVSCPGLAAEPFKSPLQSYLTLADSFSVQATMWFLTGVELQGAGAGDWLAGLQVSHRPRSAPNRTGQQVERPRPARISPDVFGSVAFPFRAVPMADRWRAIIEDGADALNKTDCRDSEAGCSGGLAGQLSDLVKVAANLPPRARLQLINSAVNAAITYRSDSESYGKIDHWATFSEVVERGTGDCEDIAIIKMWVLKAAGVPSESMHLIVLRDTRRGLYHAVLGVHKAGETYILDNTRERIHRHTQLPEYIPIYSLGWQGSWIHGFPSGTATIAGRLDAVHPGEPASRPAASEAAAGSGRLATAVPAAR